MRSDFYRSVFASCRSLLGVFVLAVTPVGSAEQPSSEHGSTSTPAELTAAAYANGRFAVDLYRRIAESESGENIFLSPFSISLALTMTAEGAIDETLDQMTNVLHIPKGSLAKIHAGQRGLLGSAVPNVPPEVSKKIAELRAELKKTNEITSDLERKRRRVEANISYLMAKKLAVEINETVNGTSAYELQITNALWLENSYPIQPNFVSTLKPFYGTVLFPVDFKRNPDPGRLRINQWVAQQTNDRIKNLLTPGTVTDQTKLVITNTVYFKGDWALPFEASGTHPERFQQSDDRSIELPMMMHQWNWKTASYGAFQSNGDLFPTPREILVDLKDNDPSLYPDEKGHTMLSLDYQGHKIQMILLVPQSATGINELEKSLTYESLERWIGQLEHRAVNITIPKYKLETTYSLTKFLRSLGMERAFDDPGQNPHGAQFDKLSSTQRPEDRLYISDVVHKTYVDVSEIGTEAAAATAVLMAPTSAAFQKPKTRPFIPIFKANKPFLFLIRDREAAGILFMGRYAGPKT